MDDQEVSGIASGPGSRASTEPVPVSAVPASIPNADKAEAVKLLTMALEAIDTGRSEPLFIARDAIRNWLNEQPASAIETQSAETEGLRPEDE